MGKARIEVVRSVEAFQCPDTETLAARVAVLRPAGAGLVTKEPDLQIKIEIDKSEEGYKARVVLHGTRQGVREFDSPGPGCGTLAQALVVSLALILDEDPTTEDIVTPRGGPGPLPTILVEQDLVEKKAMVVPWHMSAIGLVGIDYGLPAKTGLLVGGALSLRANNNLEFLMGGFWTPQTDHPYGVGKVEVTFGMGFLSGCYQLIGNERFRLSPCAMVAGGLLRGAGQGYTPDRSASRPWFGAGGMAAGQWYIGSGISVVLWTGGLAAVKRESFSVDGEGSAFLSSRGSFFTVTGLSFNFL